MYGHFRLFRAQGHSCKDKQAFGGSIVFIYVSDMRILPLGSCPQIFSLSEHQSVPWYTVLPVVVCIGWSVSRHGKFYRQ